MLANVPAAISITAHVIIATSITLGLLITFPLIVKIAFGVRGVPKTWRDRVILRYQQQWNYSAWIFAHFKTKLDPMFFELPGLLKSPRSALDVGCGFGVPGCALLEWYPELQLFGIEPARGRSRVASRVYGSRGRVFRGCAPEALNTGLPNRLDVALMLDVTHLIPDEALTQTFQRLQTLLSDGGTLIARVNVPQPDKQTLVWHLDWMHRTLTRAKTFHRPLERTRSMFEAAGFEIVESRNSGGVPEMIWLVAKPARVDKTPSPRVILPPLPPSA